MEEQTIERRFKNEIRKLKGLALKFSVLGFAGMPDRSILLPPGKVAFAELKAPGKKLRPLQRHRAKILRKLGFKVFVIDSIKAIEEFIKDVEK